ncbi:uncharacterized protein LOC120836966 [Ixodes scapularis]|uniref:uncharacterized protein LOC120836966 n=1 Tax=Ixodes scapularis TaxID=6945 RepID=UPI001A9E915A|nr:uncharacterized protein LOC120836966 [Ixodes scapularis]
MCFERSSWPQRLLSLLPAEVADFMAGLDPEEAEDYSVVKSSLLRKFRLSPEAFRIKFRQTKKDGKESYPEFAYRLKGSLESWLRGANAFEDREKILKQLALEPFFSSIPMTLKEWIQDLPEVENIQKAADYADQYCSRRREVTDDKPTLARNQPRKWDHSGSRKYEPTTDSPTPETVEMASDDKKIKRKSFEERKPIRCYKCNQAGHVAAGCCVPKVCPVNLSLRNPEELLEPYLYNIKVNGTHCKGLRDTGATYDVVHSSLVKQSDFTGDCVWIRQALEEQKTDASLAKCRESVGKDLSPNVSFYERRGILYRNFKDKSGKEVEQLVVPSRALCHDQGKDW